MRAEASTQRTATETCLRDRVDDTEWKQLLQADRRASVMQDPDFVRLLAAHHEGWCVQWLEVRDRDRALRGGLPLLVRRRWGLRAVVSGFAGTYGGPVARDAEAESALAHAFSTLGGWSTRRRELVWGWSEPPRGAWSGMEPLETAVLPVDPERPFEHFLSGTLPKNRRNEGNRSDRRGLRVEIDATGARLPEFHALYRARCAQWAIAPVPEALLRDVLARFEDTALFIALDRNDRLLGAHVVVDRGDELFAWLGTTERTQEVFPATVIVREEARWCHAHGRRSLNLGASLGLSGVENYKRLLGAEASRRWILRQRRWPAGRER